jgi:class 3 adenylate cyclase
VAERRVCSVLFCDVVGFTPLSESRDPEAVRELLSRYFEVARTVIGRYGGVVEKFIGDAVNTAARVQSAAEPGSVLVDAPTQRLAASAIGFADAGQHALKGKAELARLHRAVRVLAGVGGSQRIDGLEAR